MRSLLKCAERHAGGALPDAPARSRRRAAGRELEIASAFSVVWANQQAFSERSCATGRAQQGA